jgi:hypothetical protein
MIVRMLLMLIWTAPAVAAVASVTHSDLDSWLIASLICCIVVAWATVLFRLHDATSAGYAVLWLALIFAAIGLLMAIVLGVDSTQPDWTLLVFFVLVLAVWAVVLKFKSSPKWPLIILSVLLIPFGTIILGIIGAIGLGKLLIESVGKRNVFTRSRMTVASISVLPRGLVEPDNRGVGLVSLMVGVAILVIALTMAASTFYSASRLTRQAASFTQASNFAEGVLEQTASQPFNSIRTNEIAADIHGVSNARCMVGVIAREPGLKEVTVTCSWKEDSRQRNVRLATLVAKGGLR